MSLNVVWVTKNVTVHVTVHDFSDKKMSPKMSLFTASVTKNVTENVTNHGFEDKMHRYAP